MTTLKRLHVRLKATDAWRHERRSWIVAGWFWVSVLLVLPNCSYTPPTTSPGPNLNQGSEPRDGAVFCDIEKERRCATADDKLLGTRLAAGAVSLNVGHNGSHIGLDDSPQARAKCGGEPEAVEFYGTFPMGLSVCINCGEVLGPIYADARAVCVARCLDFFGTPEPEGTFTPENPPSAATKAYCESESNVRVATNQPLDDCFAGACSIDGSLLSNFMDPRRVPEAVEWTDFIGTAAAGNNLTKITPSNPTSSDAGAASTQRFTRGDGYVEFSASTNTLAHLIGFGTDPAACTPPCADTDPTQNDVSHGIVLFRDGRLYIAENGVLVAGPGTNGSFRPYIAGERFRVSVRDNSDGTARVTYGRVIGPCVAGTPCPVEVIHTSTIAARYPLRVDASFPDQGATLTDVTVVRIQNQ